MVLHRCLLLGSKLFLWQSDMPPMDAPILGSNTALARGWLALALRDGVYVCRCGQV